MSAGDGGGKRCISGGARERLSSEHSLLRLLLWTGREPVLGCQHKRSQKLGSQKNLTGKRGVGIMLIRGS